MRNDEREIVEKRRIYSIELFYFVIIQGKLGIIANKETIEVKNYPSEYAFSCVGVLVKSEHVSCLLI